MLAPSKYYLMTPRCIAGLQASLELGLLTCANQDVDQHRCSCPVSRVIWKIRPMSDRTNPATKRSHNTPRSCSREPHPQRVSGGEELHPQRVSGSMWVDVGRCGITLPGIRCALEVAEERVKKMAFFEREKRKKEVLPQAEAERPPGARRRRLNFRGGELENPRPISCARSPRPLATPSTLS